LQYKQILAISSLISQDQTAVKKPVMPPVLRRPASSNSRGQRRQTQPAAARPVLRRPASSNSTGQRRQTQPAAARQVRRSTQQPDGSTVFHFDFGVWVCQVALGRRPVESAPTYRDVREAAKLLKKKIKCSCCGRKRDWKDLSFRQWTSTVWTGYCDQCDR
jgi:hypothetical protein